jgi:hypothetical protein
MSDLVLSPIYRDKKEVTLAISTRLIMQRGVGLIIDLVKKYPDNYTREANGILILVLKNVPILDVFEIITAYSLIVDKVRISSKFAENKSYQHLFPNEDLFLYGGN